MGPRSHVVDWSQDQTNPFARGDNSAMRPFAKLLWTLITTSPILKRDGSNSDHIFSSVALTLERSLCEIIQNPDMNVIFYI